MCTISKQDGFTLIEALIAMAILTVGILTVFTMQIAAVKGNSTANQMTLASSVAADSFERLLQVAYNAPAMNATANPHDISTDFPGFSPPPRVTRVYWNVTDWANDGSDNDGDGSTDEGDEAGIKLVALFVDYNDKGTTKILTMNFYKHELL